MTRYLTMPIGRAKVVLIYDDTGLLCVQRTKWDARKLKMNSAWWKRAEQYLANALKPAINQPKVTVTAISAPHRIMAAGALQALSELLANGKIEYVSGGVAVNPPDSIGDIKITADLVLRKPIGSMRIH